METIPRPDARPHRGSFRQRFIERFINWYPPFLGAGIKIVHASPDYRVFKVRLKLTWYNRNYVGTHYGGSLYSMCDPFFMLILLKNLGSDYIAWDKSARIRFRKPGRTTVFATFEVPEERIREIRSKTNQSGKIDETFHVNVVDAEGNVIAEVEKVVQVRLKTAPPQPSADET